MDQATADLFIDNLLENLGEGGYQQLLDILQRRRGRAETLISQDLTVMSVTRFFTDNGIQGVMVDFKKAPGEIVQRMMERFADDLEQCHSA